MKQKITKLFRFILFLFLPKKAFCIESEKEFRKKLMDPSFDWKKYSKQENSYFSKWGLHFSNLESAYCSLCTGVKSELYVPVYFFNRVILPYLNHMDWKSGFADKNLFAKMLDIDDAKKYIDIRIPECIICCQHGRYYIKGNVACSYKEAINQVMEVNEDFIIKPSFESSHGKGVAKILKKDIKIDFIKKLFDDYGMNFTIQKVIIQHPSLAAFNPTSVNTIRVSTYQDFDGNVKILYAAQRFGGKGKIYDNADDPNGTGGFCAIKLDGTVDRKIHHYRKFKVDILDADIPEKIPCFNKIKEAVLFLHTRFPQFGLIGWDVSLTPDGHPIIIEYNLVPGLGTGQLANHPIFEKEDLDEIMKRVTSYKIKPKFKLLLSFSNRENEAYL